MKLLYFDCAAGISGDMTIGALLDLGVPLETLEGELKKLPLPHSSWSIGMERTSRKGISAAKFRVHGEEHQPHRHYRHIAGMIEGSGLSDPVKEKAQAIFFRLAQAEAQVHGSDLDHVHFHEVGALDSIIDIVGTAVCLIHLGDPRIFASPLPLGSGFIDTAHGKLPVPAPATALLLRGLQVTPGPGPGERVTPTGAAILASLASASPLPQFTVTGSGCGAGDRDFPEIPNVLRVFAGETASASGEVYLLETNLDDMTPEALGYLMERLLEQGALDVGFAPLQMKKNRPGTLLTLLAEPERLEGIARTVLRESTALGVRYHPVRRMVLERSVEERETSLGRVRVKLAREGDALLRVAPEYEDCARIAREKGMPLLEVFRTVEREIIR